MKDDEYGCRHWSANKLSKCDTSLQVSKATSSRRNAPPNPAGTSGLVKSGWCRAWKLLPQPLHYEKCAASRTGSGRTGSTYDLSGWHPPPALGARTRTGCTSDYLIDTSPLPLVYHSTPHTHEIKCWAILWSCAPSRRDILPRQLLKSSN